MKLNHIRNDRWGFEGLPDPKGFRINGKVWGWILSCIGRTFHDGQGNWVDKESFDHYLNRIKTKNPSINADLVNKTTKQAYQLFQLAPGDYKPESILKKASLMPERVVDVKFGFPLIILNDSMDSEKQYSISLEKKRDATIREFVEAVANRLQISNSNVVIMIGATQINLPEKYDEKIPKEVWEEPCLLLNPCPWPLLNPECMKLLDGIILELYPESDSMTYQVFELNLLKITNPIFKGILNRPEFPVLLKEHREKVNLIMKKIQESTASPEDKKSMIAVVNVTGFIDYALQKYDEGIKLLGIKPIADYEALIFEKLKDLPNNHYKKQANKPTMTIKFLTQSREFDKENFLKHVKTIASLLSDVHSITTEFDFAKFDFMTPDIFNQIVLYLEQGTLSKENLAELSEESILKLYDTATLLEMPRLECLVGRDIMQRLTDNKWENRQLLDRTGYPDMLAGVTKFFLEKT